MLRKVPIGTFLLQNKLPDLNQVDFILVQKLGLHEATRLVPADQEISLLDPLRNLLQPTNLVNTAIVVRCKHILELANDFFT